MTMNDDGERRKAEGKTELLADNSGEFGEIVV